MALKSIFQKFAPRKQKPVLLADTTVDNETRGDAHGFEGLVQSFAKRVDADVIQISEKQLQAAYPHIKGGHDDLFMAYINDNGCPDIYMGECSRKLQMKMENNGTRYVFQKYKNNETLSKVYLPDCELVSHHLTEEKFKTEGEKFRQHYPRPADTEVIAVLLSDLMQDDIDSVADKLTTMAKQHENSMIFVTSCWRTENDCYDRFITKLEENMQAKGMDTATQLKHFNIERAKPGDYNPYTGLLDQSSHVLVWGRSRSLVSETLSSGKTPYIFRNEDMYEKSLKDGLIKNFKTAPTENGFQTIYRKPVSVTDKIADRLLKDYKRMKKIPAWMRHIA